MVIDKKSSTLYIHIWEQHSLDEIVEFIKVNNITTLIHDSTFEYYLFVTKATYPHDEINRFIEFVESNNIDVYFFFSALGLPDNNTDKILESNNINLISFPEIFTNITLASTKTYPQIYPKRVLFSNHNGRARLHRCMMIDMLAKYNLIARGNISWNELTVDEYNFKYWDQKILKLEDNYFYDNNNQYDMPDNKYILSTFDLVSETSIDKIFYTEKTWKPIVREKAFIIFGAPGINMQLKEYGYNLFENVIDYSFDKIIDPLKRAEAIAKQLKNLAKYRPERIHQKLTQSIQHNRAHIFDRANITHSNIRAEVEKIAGSQFFNSITSFDKYSTIYNKKIMKIGFIGVGKLGKEAAEVMAEKHDVIGYDVTEVSPDNFKMVPTIKDVCQDRKLIFIAVPTPHHPDYDGRYPTSHLPNKDFDYTIVNNVLDEVNKHVNKDQLIVLISTVLPGTIRREFIGRIPNGRFIYNPYLIAMGTVKWDMVNPEMIIIGTEDGTTTGDAKLLLEFYETFITEGTRYEVGTWDEAEGIKIFYNTFISTKVALVNMIQDVAEKNGNMNVDVVTGALERSTYRILGKAYMKAGMGDGGGCHPRDNIALRYMAEKLDLGYDLFDAIMKAREVQAKNLALKMVMESYKTDLPLVILGKAYKPDVEYEDGSSSILVGHYCESAYGDRFKVIYDPVEPIKAIYLLGHMGKHHDYDFPEGSVVIDPWRSFVTDKDITVIHYGNTR